MYSKVLWSLLVVMVGMEGDCHPITTFKSMPPLSSTQLYLWKFQHLLIRLSQAGSQNFDKDIWRPCDFLNYSSYLGCLCIWLGQVVDLSHNGFILEWLKTVLPPLFELYMSQYTKNYCKPKLRNVWRSYIQRNVPPQILLPITPLLFSFFLLSSHFLQSYNIVLLLPCIGFLCFILYNWAYMWGF